MARGITAFVFIVALILSMSILGSVGYYAEMHIDMDVEGQNQDVEEAADQLSGIEFGEGRSGSILQGPLAVVTPVVSGYQVFSGVLGNTSGVLQLLYGLPKGVADTLEMMFRLVMFITLIYLIRSGSPV